MKKKKKENTYMQVSQVRYKKEIISTNHKVGKGKNTPKQYIYPTLYQIILNCEEVDNLI